MTRRTEHVYAMAALLALAMHAGVLTLSWEEPPKVKIQTQGSPGVEIRLAAIKVPAPMSEVESDPAPEPAPIPEVVPQPPPPTPEPGPVPERRPPPRHRTSAASAPPAAVSAPAASTAVTEAAAATPEPLGALENKSPQYPKLARQRGQEGEVTLRVEVSGQGQALNVSIQKSSGHSLLDKAALDAVKKWRFRPARQNGAPVPGTAVVIVEFRLE